MVGRLHLAHSNSWRYALQDRLSGTGFPLQLLGRVGAIWALIQAGYLRLIHLLYQQALAAYDLAAFPPSSRSNAIFAPDREFRLQ